VRVFQVIAGKDQRDPATMAATHPPQDYLAALERDGLRGATIGVLRQAYERPTTDAEILRVFQTALEDLRRAGARIVDPANVEGLDEIKRAADVGPCMGFKYDLDQFLAARGAAVPFQDLRGIVRSRRFHPNVQARLEALDKTVPNGPDTDACKAEMEYRDKVRAAVLKTMDRLNLDAFVYPTWSNPPRLIGDLNTPHGDNSQFFSPTTGFPAINVPMGYTRAVLPAGMTIYGRPWSEALLFKFAYAYEQATRHRRPPASTPPIAE
jgi:Asp-tRNA(Asn)/Glu-tRNA(Gln) amidotransferase A subunit family amidase